MLRYLFQVSAAANLTLNLPYLVLGRGINRFWFDLKRLQYRWASLMFVK